jgi:hypothetical protein
MNGNAFFTSLIGLMVGVLGTYATFYVRGALARREQVAKSLADFYASAAVAYYAARDLEITKSANKSEERYLAFYKLFDEHYREFLSSSTVLASLVPPRLTEDILRIEDVWDDVNQEGFTPKAEKAWFDLLDATRYKVLDSISYNRVIDPFWKR